MNSDIKTRIKVILTSKTFWGTVLTAGAWLANQPHIGITEVVQAIGPVLTAAGFRDLFTKYF